MLMDPLLARECQQAVPSSFLGFEDVVQIDHSWDGTRRTAADDWFVGTNQVADSISI